MADSKRPRERRQGTGSEPPVLDIGSVLAAFSEEQVERITKLAKGRLRYWAATNFFKPSYVEEEKNLPFSRFYSFKDIVALRTLELLRVQNNVTLQHLRRVAERLSHLEDRLWTSTTFFVINRKVVIVNEDSESAEELLTGQYILGIPLNKIIADTRAEVIAFRQRPKAAFGQLTRNRGVIRNALVVAGTRVPVVAIKRLSEDGYSKERIIAEYPDLTEKDIEAALSSKDVKAA